MNKIRVGILFGGRSAEHEVSLQSAKNVVEAIDKGKYEVVLVGIDKTGKWLLPDQSEFLLNADDPKRVSINDAHETDVALVPQSRGALTTLSGETPLPALDVVFPILHGPFGEDGTVQGLLKLAGVPFVGASVLGAAVGMDKDVMKRLLRDAGLPIGKFLTFRYEERVAFEETKKELGLPMFVKPANLGSSIGVSKVRNEEEFKKAVEEAFQYDTKIIVEEFISGRELECAILGNDHPEASGVGEVIPQRDFYSYEAKYIDEDGAILKIPADIPEETVKRIQETALKTFQALEGVGLGRVDVFLTAEDQIFVNEINTMPGFTKISMYPQLWAQSGISYPDLIDRLITLAIERFAQERQLK